MELDLAHEEEVESNDESDEEEMDEDESDDAMDDDDDDEEEEEEEGEVVTKQMLNTWTLAASKKSPEAFKQLLLAFRSIAHDEAISPKYRVTNSKGKCSRLFNAHLIPLLLLQCILSWRWQR